MTTNPQYPHQVPGFPVPHKYPPFYMKITWDHLQVANVHHDSGTGDGQSYDGWHSKAWENGRPHDVGRRWTVRGSVRELEEVDVDASTHGQSLSTRIGERTSPFLVLSNGEYIVGQVYNKSLDPKREWRDDTPPLDRLSTHGRRDTNESKAVIPRSTRSEKIPAGDHDGMKYRDFFQRQLVNAPHYPPCIGPLACIILACFSTLGKTARNTGVVAQASRK